MLKFKLLTALFLSFSLASFSQTPALTGTLKDAETKQPLFGATVKIVSGKDSSSVLTNKAGVFEFKYFNPGTYKMTISYLGYELLKKEVVWENVTKKLDDILINKEAKTLSGVTVVSTPPIVKQKADTVEISASQLKVNPDANTEDLIKKAPGITVENGQVKVGGEQVKKVTVDGRDFFGDDATATLRNLPAEIVDKIQVFDRMSDQAQFTGVDDGSAAKSINIVTKANMRNGNFGRLFAGYGTDNHYLAGGNMSYFKNNKRLSIVTLFNDVNQQNFAEIDLLGATGSSGGGGFRQQSGGRQGGGGFGGGGGNFGGGGGANFGGGGFLIGQQPGVSKTNSIGLNYNDKWGKKVDISGSYFYNSRKTVNSEDISREYFDDSSQILKQKNISSNNNFNHRASFRLDWKLDSFNSILITPSVNIQSFESASDLAVINYFSTPDNKISETLNKSNSKRNAYNFNNNLLYRHSFRKKGRTFSVSLNTGINNQDGETFTDAYTKYYKRPVNFSDTTLQYYDQISNGYQLSSSLNYTEPVGKKGAILEFRYNPSYSSNNSDKKAYYLNDLSGKYSDFDTSLSNVFDNKYLTQRGGISFRKGDRNKQISFGLDFQSASLDNNQIFPKPLSGKRTFANVLPNAQINLPLSKRENVRIFYRASTNPPSISQLQDVINDQNKLQLSTGNPDLKQQFRHQLGGRYQYTNALKGNTVLVNFFGSAASNYIATATYIAQRDSVLTPTVTLYKGSQLTKPVNLDGQWNLNTFITYAQALKFIKTNMNLNAGIVYNRTPGFINKENGVTRSLNFNTGVVFASNISQYIDFTVSYSANFNRAKNSLQPDVNNNYFMSNGGVKLNLLSKKGWLLNTDITNQSYKGLSDGFNQNYWLWNMAVAKKLFKKQAGEIRFSVFDLLNQNQSITRTVSETYLEDVITKVVKQYFMLTFTYNLKNFGKAPVRQQNFNPNFMGDFRRN